MHSKGHFKGHNKIIGRLCSLTAAAELKDRLPKRCKMFFMVTESLAQRQKGWNTESSKMSNYVPGSITLKFYCQNCILHIQINNHFVHF